MRLQVTQHAMTRWKQRFGGPGRDRDIGEALAKARPPSKAQRRRIAERAGRPTGTRYHLVAGEVLFICDGKAVITVLSLAHHRALYGRRRRYDDRATIDP